jgi:leader peptidase (prepilin peptidase)/N-methyltransferase
MKLINYSYEWIDVLILLVFFIPIIIFDIKEKRIPNIFIILGAGILFIKRLLFDFRYMPSLLIDTLAAFIIIACLWFFSKGKIGLGDAKLSGFIAMAIGLFGWFIALFIASFSGLLFALTSIKLKKRQYRDPLPFAPFLGLGCLVSLLVKHSFYTLITGLV